MTDIAIEPTRLAHDERSLRGTADLVADLDDRALEFDPGDPSVAAALDAFGNGWSRRQRAVVADLIWLAAALDAAIEAFVDLDSALSSGFVSGSGTS